MFSLKDFFHLPQLDHWVEKLSRGEPGLTVVAGLDAHPGILTGGNSSPAGLLPSGRSAIFSILIEQVLDTHPRFDCLVIARDRHAVRIPRQFQKRMRIFTVDPPFSYTGRIEAAIEKQPGLLVLDQLDGETVQLALNAAGRGLFVLSPLDTVFHGVDVAHHLLDLGASPEQLAALRWVISVQRLGTLCNRCKKPAFPNEDQLSRLRAHPLLNSRQLELKELISAFSNPETLQLFRPAGCSSCRDSGRQGDVAVFDVFHNPVPANGFSEAVVEHSVLPMEAYVADLALLGYLSLDDFLDFRILQHRRIGYTLLAREAALAETLGAHERNLTTLEAANRVLQQRTRSLVSLQEIGQALLTSADLKDLAARVCRFAHDLCGADRVIVYYLHTDQDAETLAASGWDPERVPQRSNPSEVFGPGGVRILETNSEPATYNRWPPGIAPRHPDVEGAELRAGLVVPLVAQEKRVGFILAHATRKANFSPKEVSLLQTLAQQTALGIQRARLIDDLRNKIIQLEAAQDELAKKERLERELELARQVQQSMLPDKFPEIPGFHFAARYKPAHLVGGDFYDVIRLDDERFGVVIADVSDKGMPAALYMALTRSLLVAEARRQASPQTVLRNINQLLLELGDGKTFVTLFYGVIDRSSGLMVYSRAGHDRPFLLRNGGVAPLGGDGTPLGILDEDFRLSEEEVLLEPGDRLVLYTDGLTDVSSQDGRLFDLDQWIALLQASTGQSLGAMSEALFAGLVDFQGEAEQYDDMTLLLVQVA